MRQLPKYPLARHNGGKNQDNQSAEDLGIVPIVDHHRDNQS
jgi:inorganic pyrophosphatase/exopolyphosphatase